jgi:CHAT domain-containing protein/Tfp pilus assembly protein PilF
MPDAVLSIYSQGQELVKAGKAAEAAERLKTAAGQTGGSTATWFLLQTANISADGRLWDAADRGYEDAVKSAGSSAPAIEAQLFRSWGDAYRSRSDWKNAESCYQRAIAENRKSAPESLATAKDLTDLGNIALQSGNLAKGEEYHRQALDIRKHLAPVSLDLATSFHGLGNAAYLREDLATAEQYYSQALDIRQELSPGSFDVASSLNNLGNVAKDRGDLRKAEERYLKALAIKSSLTPGSLDLGTTLNNLGLVAWEQGDLAKAEDYLHQALDIRQRFAPGSLGVAASIANLGLVADARGDIARAEGYYLQGLDIQEKLAPGSVEVAKAFNNLGGLAWIQGDLANAEAYYRKALEIQTKLVPGRLALALTLNNLGLVARARGDFAKADEYIRSALDIRNKEAPGSLDVAASIRGLASVAENLNDLVKAEDYYKQALAIQLKVAPESMSTAEDYNALADIAKYRKDLAPAEEYYRLAEAIRGKLAPQSDFHAESLASLGGVLRFKGQPDSAARLYEQALQAFEGQTARLGGAEETRSSFRAAQSSYFIDYIDLLMWQKRPDLAFHVAERWRARSLIETLTEARVDIRQGVDPELRSRERSLEELLRGKSDRRIRLLTAERPDERRLAEVEKEISDLRDQYNDLLGRIKATSPIYAALTHPRPLSVEQTQQLLDDDTVLLEYVLGEERSYVWAVTRYSLHGYELPSRSKVDELARQLYSLASAPNGATLGKGEAAAAKPLSFQKTAAALSRMVVGPVAPEISGKRLLIVADGALQYVPFAALPLPGSTKAVPLIVEHEIVYAPSASVVAELRRQASGRPHAPKTVAVLADPVFDREDPRIKMADQGTDRQSPSGANANVAVANEYLARAAADTGLAHLPRLPFSKREADAIMAVTPPGQGKESLGFDADRATATSPELAQYRIVHFATHALSDSQHPELSGLVLSLVGRDGKPQDGFLDLQRIYNLNLPAELVVLSGCQTGLGKEIKGEGIVGLTRGFMYAGAARVVASLWNAEDVSTKELMEKFYVAIEQQGLRPAAALRQAQIAMWKQKRWNAPYYWAAFGLQGEWR